MVKEPLRVWPQPEPVCVRGWMRACVHGQRDRNKDNQVSTIRCGGAGGGGDGDGGDGSLAFAARPEWFWGAKARRYVDELFDLFLLMPPPR